MVCVIVVILGWELGVCMVLEVLESMVLDVFWINSVDGRGWGWGMDSEVGLGVGCLDVKD